MQKNRLSVVRNLNTLYFVSFLQNKVATSKQFQHVFVLFLPEVLAY